MWIFKKKTVSRIVYINLWTMAPGQFTFSGLFFFFYFNEHLPNNEIQYESLGQDHWCFVLHHKIFCISVLQKVKILNAWGDRDHSKGQLSEMRVFSSIFDKVCLKISKRAKTHTNIW